MKLLIPSLLFSSLLSCPQGGPEQEPDLCPELLHSIVSLWPLLLLPLIWVGSGLLLGLLAAKVSAAGNLWGTVVAACAFGNSTGLPITLLSALASVPVTGTSASQLQQWVLL